MFRQTKAILRVPGHASPLSVSITNIAFSSSAVRSFSGQTSNLRHAFTSLSPLSSSTPIVTSLSSTSYTPIRYASSYKMRMNVKTIERPMVLRPSISDLGAAGGPPVKDAYIPLRLPPLLSKAGIKERYYRALRWYQRFVFRDKVKTALKPLKETFADKDFASGPALTQYIAFLKAFSAGNRDVLKDLCTFSFYSTIKGDVDDREPNHLRVWNVVGQPKASVVNIVYLELDPDASKTGEAAKAGPNTLKFAQITVKFESQQMLRVYDKKLLPKPEPSSSSSESQQKQEHSDPVYTPSALVDGSENPVPVTDYVVFERALSTKGSQWRYAGYLTPETALRSANPNASGLIQSVLGIKRQGGRLAQGS